MNTSKKYLIAYHANCVDGFTAAWVAHNAIKEMYEQTEIELLPMEYNQKSYSSLELKIEPSLYCKVFILDLSIPVELLHKIADKAVDTHIIIFDHHKSAFEKYFPLIVVKKDSFHGYTEGNFTVRLDNSISGAMLTWHNFNIETPPKLLEYVQDYDLWHHSFGEDTKRLNMYIRTFPMTISDWDVLKEIVEDPITKANALEVGQELIDMHNLRVIELVESASKFSLGGVVGLLANAPVEFCNDVGELLAKESGTFGATYYSIEEELTGKITHKYSIRSTKETGVDVSALAKLYGGGGHKHAAGFEIALNIVVEEQG